MVPTVAFGPWKREEKLMSAERLLACPCTPDEC